jgi:hypothetical protein
MTDKTDTVTHTPLPWVEDPLNLELVGDISTMDGSQCVAQAQQVHGDGLKQPIRKANAALIVRAVNNHADLVQLAHQYASDLRHPPSADSVERRLERIAAVLAKVGA